MAIANYYYKDAEKTQGLAYLSKVTLPNGETYEIKDSAARNAIENLQGIEGLFFSGVKEELPASGSKNGEVIIVGNKEYVWAGAEGAETWHEFGDLSELGALAYKDSASTTVVVPTVAEDAAFTGTKATINVEGSATGDITISSTEQVDGNYQPAGTISKPDVTVTPDKVSVTSIASVGTLPTKAADTFQAGTLPEKADDTFTAGTLPTFTEGAFSAGELPSKAADTFDGGTAAAWGAAVEDETLSFSWTANTVATYTEGEFTPGELPSKAADTFTAGTLPEYTEGAFTPGTLPSYTEGEFTQGSLPTMADAVEVLQGATAALAATPEFTGTKVQLGASFSNGAIVASGEYTPEGSVAVTVGSESKTITVQ